jgi:hypothetical protein
MIVAFRDVSVATKRDAFCVTTEKDARSRTTSSVSVVVVLFVVFRFFRLTVDATQNTA